MGLSHFGFLMLLVAFGHGPDVSIGVHVEAIRKRACVFKFAPILRCPARRTPPSSPLAEAEDCLCQQYL